MINYLITISVSYGDDFTLELERIELELDCEVTSKLSDLKAEYKSYLCRPLFEPADDVELTLRVFDLTVGKIPKPIASLCLSLDSDWYGWSYYE